MANSDDPKKGLPMVPALPRDPASSTAPEDPTPAALGQPEQLGFDLRFEAGKTLLALKDKNIEPGVTVARALFEVPDVDYPLNVSGGVHQFQNRRLSLRAIELTLTHASLYVADKLKAAGFTLIRERSRAGGIELLVEMQGPGGAVPIRARGLFAPVGEAGVALVLHEVISFSPLPRSRTEIAQALLDALHLPGAQPSRAMLRRADPFRAVLSRLLPSYGWKVPAVGDVRVHEVVLGKGEVTLRAWARELPEGWKAPREQKRGPLEDAVALAVFADGLAAAPDDNARLLLIDRLVDDGALSPSVAPFAAELLRRGERRRAEGDDLVARALDKSPEHLGLLAAHAEQAGIEPAERARRLQALGKAADGADEPWVAARAFLVAAGIAHDAGDKTLALACAEAAFLADPSEPETGTLTSRLLAESGDFARALSVGRTALERAEDPAAADAFAVNLAALAKRVEGLESARVLLRRALRKADRKDALVALIDVEVEAGALERAAELLTRLLVVVNNDATAPVEARADVETLAARLAEARGDREAARMHLSKARDLRPTDPVVAVRLATLLDDNGQLDRAVEVLREAVEVVDAPAAPLVLAARLAVKRKAPGDAERARAFIARVGEVERTPAVIRLDAEAQALLGAPSALAEILAAEAELPAGVAKLLEAARLFVEANRIADAANVAVRALPHDTSGVAELLSSNGAELVRAVDARADAVGAEKLHAVASKLAGAGRPKDAHALLASRRDRNSVELRAAFADAAGETTLEIDERNALLTLLDAKVVGADAQKAAATYKRLGALHIRPGGLGPGAAADAWAAAADLGSVDVGVWLEAALAAGSGARLAAVLRRDDAEVQNVPSMPLRAAIRALTDPGDSGARLKLAAVLAARAENLDDVETYLNEARALPPALAADVLADAGVRHGRGAWLLEAADILEKNGQVKAALARLLSASGAAAADPAVAERTFSVAIAAKDGDAVDASAKALLTRNENDRGARLAVHARRAHALIAIDPARGRTALGLWLDEDPRSEEALGFLVPDLVKRGELAYALDRLEKACRPGPAAESARAGSDADGGAGPLAASLASLAGAAQKKGDVAVEIRARELLVGASALGGADVDLRAQQLERLADLYGEAGRTQSAVDVLTARVALGGSDDKLAALYTRAAALLERELNNKPAAADALRGHLRHAADDAQASRHLQALLGELADDAGLKTECLRRAGRLKPGAERTELLLKAGDAALRIAVLADGGGRAPESLAAAASARREARDVWLRALKSAPYSQEALERLLTLGRTTKNHRLIVRARVSAAQTIADGPAAAEQAAEAGAYLYGFIGRTRLALAAFRFAELHDKKPHRHTRVIIDLHRSLGDGKAALAAVDRLIDKAKITEKAVLLETRAEVLDELLQDPSGAADARRAALEVDPTLRTAARALSRWLRDTGAAREALDVDRAWADAALEGTARASAYAVLAARAEDDLKDAALTAELCAHALGVSLPEAQASSTGSDADVRNIEVLRRYARALAASGAETAAVDAWGRLLELGIPVDEKIAIVRQKAGLESGSLGQKQESRRTLRRALDDLDLASHPDAETLVLDLAAVEEELDEPASAASVLLRALERAPEGSRILGPRKATLERAACLLDDAGERARALDLLEEASAGGGAELSRAGELRRARIAEELDRHDIAVSALERLLALASSADAPASASTSEERVALLGRLAIAAEKSGRADKALAAWQGRVERAPGDADALRAIERLGRVLGRAGDARTASDALLLLEAGNDDERFDRLLACARDSRDRLLDARAASALLDKARAIRSDAALRKEALACAESAGDAEAALALLDEMRAKRDPVEAVDVLRRAELRLDLKSKPGMEQGGSEMGQGFDDLVAALDLGVAVDDRVRALVDRCVGAEPNLVAKALLECSVDAGPFSLGGGPTAQALRAAFSRAHLRDDSLDAAILTALADALPGDDDVVMAAAERQAAQGHGARAADRLWALADRPASSSGAGAPSSSSEAGASPSDLGGALGAAGSATAGDDDDPRRRDLRQRAAELLLSSAGAESAVLGRLHELRPSLRQRADLRGQALVLLRDAEAWDAVALVLEDAVQAALPTEARALRLELVSVLRTGLEDEKRAVVHLQALVDADPDDREAWGELLECIDALGDKPRLADALGRRADLSSGIEKRELVRRKSAVLLELNRGAEALVQLIAVRAEAPADVELKRLERRIHEERGTVELGAFLAAELERAPDALDAEALLALDPEAVAPPARVHAHLVLADDDDRARLRARAILEAPASAERRIGEAVAVAERLAGERGAAFLAGLAAGAHALGSLRALALSDSLFARNVPGTAKAFGVAAVRRRWRVEGAGRTAADVERVRADAQSDVEKRRASLLALRRAVRVGDVAAAEDAALDAGLDAAATDAFTAALESRSGVNAQIEIETRARRAVRAQAASGAALVASVRAGDVARGQARLERLLTDGAVADVERAARRARHITLTPARLGLRLALAASLPENMRRDELMRAAATAMTAERWSEAARALDGVLSLSGAPGDASASAMRARADVAWKLNAIDASDWSTRAADALERELSMPGVAGLASLPDLPDVPSLRDLASDAATEPPSAAATEPSAADAPTEPPSFAGGAANVGNRGGARRDVRAAARADLLRHRKRAVEGLLRTSKSQLSEVGLDRALLAYARAAPDDGAVQNEALGIAQASGLHDVVDELMAVAAERSAGDDTRVEATRRRAEHRLRALKDAAGAFAILTGARGAPEALRDAAYRLAAGEGLVEAQIDVVDDDFAKAGLLALLGKSAAAAALAKQIAENSADPASAAAAWLLVAEIAALEGDNHGEAHALEKLGATGAADAQILMLLVGLDRRRGKLEEAAVRAAELVERFGASADRVALLVEVAGGGAGAARAAPILRALVESGSITTLPAPLRDRVLDVWEAAAHLSGLGADVRTARLRRCRQRDEDDLWVSFLVAEIAGATPDEAALWLRPLLSRKSLVRRVVEQNPKGLAEALGVLVKSGDASLVVDAVGAVDGSGSPSGSVIPAPPLAPALRSELASALSVLGRPADAARVLLRGPAEPGTGGRRAARAAQLFLDGDELRGAVDALLEAPLSEMDEDLVALARTVARQAGGEGALLLIRVARATADEGDIDAALALAEHAPPDVGLAIAGWRLKTHKRDDRAWRLAAAHAGGAQQHFAIALALFGLAPWPTNLVDDGARVRRLKDATIPVHVARAWAEARRSSSVSPGNARAAILVRARTGTPAERKDAWRDLAAGAATQKDDIAAARLLSRAGVPMSEAPIEVRLAADPALGAPDKRVAAIADAVNGADMKADAAAGGTRRAALVLELEALDARGWAGARVRQDVHGARNGIVGHIDGNDLGAGVDAAALVRALGRRGSPAARATAASLLAVAGHSTLAALVDPRVYAMPRLQPTAADLERTALARADAKKYVEAAALLRLCAALSGYDGPRERRIQELADKGGRVDLVVESLGRMAGAAREKSERAGILRERALVRAQHKPMLRAASRDAQAAHEAVPTDADTAALWLQLAELAGDDRDIAGALGAVARTTTKESERSSAAARRVRILTEKLGDEGGALAAVEDSLRVLPGDPALLEERARVLFTLAKAAPAGAHPEAGAHPDAGAHPEAGAHPNARAPSAGGAPTRGRMDEAARAFDDAAAARPVHERKPLRRASADAWAAAGNVDAAIGALCTSFAEGDLEALDVAEPLARDRASPASLERVLSLLLGAASAAPAVQGDANATLREDAGGAREAAAVSAATAAGTTRASLVAPARRRVLTLERARLLGDKLGDRAGAIALLEAQAIADEGDLGARLALAGWYLEDRRVLDAGLAYESAARISGLPPLSVGPAAREAACLLASLGDLERAGPLAETAINGGVVDHKVLAVASAWHRAHGRFHDVDAVLGKEIDLEADPFAQATMWMERAELRRAKLDDPTGARKAIHRVLELVPDHEAALDAMKKDAEREGTWGPLRAALFRAADFAGKPAVQKQKLREIALVDADRFQDLKAAVATVDRALEIDPDDAQTLVLKARLLVRDGQVDGVPVLIERAEKAGATELPGILQLVRGDGLLISGDRDAAHAAFVKASRDPEVSAKAWDRLIDLADGTPAFASTLEDARRNTEDNKRKVSLLRKEARVRHKAGDDDGQLGCLEQLLALEPGDTDALKVVRDAYTRRRKLLPLVPLMTAWARALDVEHFGKERSRRLGELGAFILDELGNEQLARDTFEEALGVDPDETTSLLRLADIAWAARDDERALEILDRIDPEKWPRDPVDLAYRRARCAYALGHNDASERLRAVLRLDAKHQDALEMMVKLALAKNDDDAAELALEALTAAIPPREDPVRAAGAYLELSNLRSRLGRHNEALVAAERAFELDPTNVAVLEGAATVREHAGKHLEAAEAWRRVAATRVGAGRNKSLEKRAESLFRGGKVADAIEVLIDLRRETGDTRYREEAERWAKESGDPAVMRKAGLQPPVSSGPATESEPPEITRTQTMASDSSSSSSGARGSNRGNQRGFNALHMQVRANLEENDPVTALRIVEEAIAAGGADFELLQLGVDAAEKANQPQKLVELVEARLKVATDGPEVKQLARLAGKVAKERLLDPDRAAALMYQAHQADAEDIEVRLELTQVYAQIPRLSSHAVTGILQLLRRTPSDPRVFALGADLAESQQQPERARSMRAVESILRGKGVPQEAASKILDERPQLRPLDAEAIHSRLAPTGWGGPLQQLLGVLGSAVETVLGEQSPPADAVPLHEKSPRGALALDRLERVLPGRPFRVLAGNVDHLSVFAAGAPAVVLPVDVLSLGDAALLAAVARAYGIVRLGAMMPEVLRAGDETVLVEVIRSAFGSSPDARGARLLTRLRDEELKSARALASQAVGGIVDVGATLGILQRAADRFALVVSGSLTATLHAGALPTLLREPPQKAAALLQGSTRALELCAFAARDNAWLLRRQHGFST